MQEILTHAAVILDGELIREAPLDAYLGQKDTWTVAVRDEDTLRASLDAGWTLKSGPVGEGTLFLEAPGADPEELLARLVGSGAGLHHFTAARMGLQASFEALVEERRAATGGSR